MSWAFDRARSRHHASPDLAIALRSRWSGSPGKGRALGVGEVKFRGYITPETRLVRYEVRLRQVRRGKLAMAVGNGRLFADGACVYTAADLKVGMIAAPN